jgi:hypothetical protein
MKEKEFNTINAIENYGPVVVSEEWGATKKIY